MEAIVRHNDDRIDELEAAMFEAALSEDSDIHFVECPLNHYFTPNLYVREILMSAGQLITSEVHKTCHPFVVLQGSVSVKIDDDNWQLIQAPHFGITQAGTRRVLFIHADTVWQTYHPLEFIKGDENELPQDEMMKVVDKIVDEILEPYENKLLGGRMFLNKINNTKIIAE